MNHVMMVLDETGSMAGQEKRVIGGVREYLNSLGDIEAHVTIRLFDSERWRVSYDGPLADAKPPEDYAPGAMTPLYDAIGKAVVEVRGRAKTGEKVSLVIDTDGMENHSKEYDHEKIKAVLKQCEDEGWAVVFLGSGLDANKASWVAGQGDALRVANVTSTSHVRRSVTYGALGNATSEYFRGAVASTAVSSTADEILKGKKPA